MLSFLDEKQAGIGKSVKDKLDEIHRLAESLAMNRDDIYNQVVEQILRSEGLTKKEVNMKLVRRMVGDMRVKKLVDEFRTGYAKGRYKDFVTFLDKTGQMVSASENEANHAWNNFMKNKITHEGNEITIEDWLKVNKHDNQAMLDLATEMRALSSGKDIGVTNNRGAIAFARFYSQVRDRYRDGMLQNGVRAVKRYDYQGTQKLAQSEVARVGKEQFITKQMSRYDWEGMGLGSYTEQERIDFLTKQYDNIVDGDYNSYAQSIYLEPTSSQGINIRSKWEQGRLVKYKTDQDYVDAMIDFTEQKNLFDIAMVDTVKLAHDFAIIDIYGADAAANYRRVRKEIGLIKDENVKNADKTFQNITGEAQMLGNHKYSAVGARIAGDVRNYTTAAFLGDLPLQLFSEPAVSNAVVKGYSGQSRSLVNAYMDIFRRIEDQSGREAFSSVINVHANAMIGNTMSGIGRHSDVLAEGRSGRLVNTMYNKIKIHSYEHNTKAAAIGTVSHAMYLHKQMGRGFEEFLDMQAEFGKLTKFGITKDEFDLFTSLEPFTATNGKKYFTTDPIKDIDDNTIKQKLLGGRGSKVAIDSARRELQRKFAGYYLDVANTAILTPNASDRSLTNWGFKRGTWAGEAARASTHMMTYPMMIMNRVVFPMMEEGSFGQLAVMMGQMTALGYITVLANDLYSGKTRDYFSDDIEVQRNLFFEAFAKGGAGGIFFDLIYSQAKYGHPLESKFGGTTLGAIKDVGGILYDAANAATDMVEDGRADEDVQRFLSDTIKTTRKYIPMGEVPIVNQILDHAMYYSIESVNPRAWQRMEDYWKQETGGGYLLEM